MGWGSRCSRVRLVGSLGFVVFLNNGVLMATSPPRRISGVPHPGPIVGLLLQEAPEECVESVMYRSSPSAIASCGDDDFFSAVVYLGLQAGGFGGLRRLEMEDMRPKEHMVEPLTDAPQRYALCRPRWCFLHLAKQ